MSKLISTSILCSTLMLIFAADSHAGWKDELKKAGKKVEQVGRAVRDPQGEDAQKVLHSDARNLLHNPGNEMNKFCGSATNKIGGALENLAHRITVNLEDCTVNPATTSTGPQ